jgi:hypothetical protein
LLYRDHRVRSHFIAATGSTEYTLWRVSPSLGGEYESINNMEHEDVGDSTDGGTAAAPPEGEATGRTERLSFARLAMALAMAVAAVVAVVLVVQRQSDAVTTSDRSWSVPYVDVTLTPTYQFQNPDSNPARDIALAFVVGDPDDGCSPSWGGAYSLDEADRTSSCRGGSTSCVSPAATSWSPSAVQANTELAVSCTDVGDLTDAYAASSCATTCTRSTSTSKVPPSPTPTPTHAAARRSPPLQQDRWAVANRWTCG